MGGVVGVVGFGGTGRAMSCHLRAGREAVVHDVDPLAAKAASEIDMRAAAAAAAAAADLAVRASRDVSPLDAPPARGERAASPNTSAALVGGDALTDVVAVVPPPRHFAPHVVRVGRLCAEQVAKALNNYLPRTTTCFNEDVFSLGGIRLGSRSPERETRLCFRRKQDPIRAAAITGHALGRHARSFDGRPHKRQHARGRVRQGAHQDHQATSRPRDVEAYGAYSSRASAPTCSAGPSDVAN